MTLDEWRKSQGMSYPVLARKRGAAGATVARRWCLPSDHKDRMIPSPKFMRVIQDSTHGAVQPNDFYR